MMLNGNDFSRKEVKMILCIYGKDQALAKHIILWMSYDSTYAHVLSFICTTDQLVFVMSFRKNKEILFSVMRMKGGPIANIGGFYFRVKEGKFISL